MSTTFHTAISSGAAANASTINTPLGTLDAAIAVAHDSDGTLKAGAVDGAGVLASGVVTWAKLATGSAVEAETLKQWTEGECYELTAITYDSDGVPTTATVKWPDGSAGTWTTVTKNSTWLAVDAFTVSHTASSKTVTQAAITRDANGQVTVKPALTVA